MDTVCECCELSFPPLPTVKNQRYCRKRECQNTRKKSWLRMKLAYDNDYRENQAKAQKAWREKHPGYWKEYRARNPVYTERNRLLQRARNLRRMWAAPLSVIATMGEWVMEIGVISASSMPVHMVPDIYMIAKR